MHNLFMNTFAENLKTFRKRAKLTQDDFAVSVGVSVDTVRRWEGENQEPRLGELINIANTLEVSIEELIGGLSIKNMNQEKSLDKTVRPYKKRNSEKKKIIIQTGSTRLEMPADTQGYAIIREKLKDVSFSQNNNSPIVSLEE